MSRIISGKGPTDDTNTVSSVSSQHISMMAIPEVNITGNNVVNVYYMYTLNQVKQSLFINIITIFTKYR